MSATKGIRFGKRFFWAYDEAAGVFLKHLIDEAESSDEASTEWLSSAVSHWRVQAAVTESGMTLDEGWSASQRQSFIKLAEMACAKLATREAIPAKEITDWPLADDLRITHRGGAAEVRTEPIIELGRAIIAMVSGNLPRAPKGQAWFYGLPEGHSTIDMEPPWDEY